MSAVQEVEDLPQAFDVLARDQGVLVCYARLLPDRNMETLKERMSSENVFIRAFRTVSGLEVEDEGLLTDLGVDLSGDFRNHADQPTLSLAPLASLSFANGKSLVIPSRIEGGEIGLVAVQGDWRNTVSGEKHRDDRNAVCTANIYLDGKGVRYRIPSPSLSIAFHSPVMTVHRGLAHPLCKTAGEGVAAEHARQHNEKRSNIIFCYVPDGFSFS